MIELYTWQTSNGRKASIVLEEMELPYNVHPIRIGEGDQFTPEFTKINPNQKIPAIIDLDGPDGMPITVFESGAILIYLADKTGKFMPAEARKRYEVLQWLMFQMGGIGPIFGQVHHFKRAAKEQVPYALERFGKEAERVYGVLDGRLAGNEWLAAGEYTIADIATYPWVSRYDWQEIDLGRFPNVKRWFDTISQRPAVQKGMFIPPI
ncbi:MAG: glutathione S-transferase N-terminal domain-containing protein [SAR324 cluster bacterium]|nr:glutathione S-transferase N-terminal domain-containing protein [SAR324 cluster bacterium]